MSGIKFYNICPECVKSIEKKALFIGGNEVHLTDDRSCRECLSKLIELDDYRICEFCGHKTFIDNLKCRECGTITTFL